MYRTFCPYLHRLRQKINLVARERVCSLLGLGDLSNVFKKVEEQDFQKLLNSMKEPQPIIFKLSLDDFQSKIAFDTLHFA